MFVDVLVAAVDVLEFHGCIHSPVCFADELLHLGGLVEAGTHIQAQTDLLQRNVDGCISVHKSVYSVQRSS